MPLKVLNSKFIVMSQIIKHLSISSSILFEAIYLIIRTIAVKLIRAFKIGTFTLKTALFCIVILTNINTSAQNVISLEWCHITTDSLFPLVPQKEKLAAIGELERYNFHSGYLPSIELNARFSYQSKVTEVPFPTAVPGLESPTVPHEQYGATVDVSQVIYDGGTIKRAKNLTNLKTIADIQQIEVDLFKVKERVTQLYFLSLLLQENKKIIELAHENISEHLAILKSSVKNGMVNESELDNLNAELISLEQQMIEIESSKSQATAALSRLSCIKISATDSLTLPDLNYQESINAFRPEHQLFLNQSDLLDANIELAGAVRMPKVMAFGSGGIGYPGLNMFSESMEPYFIVGAQLKWEIWDWKQTKRNKEKFELQKLIIEDNKTVFDKNMQTELDKAKHEYRKINLLIEKDEKIIELRQKISNRSASQLKNGIITSADYITNLNAEKQARINLKTHEIQKLQACANLLNSSGKPLFPEIK